MSPEHYDLLIKAACGCYGWDVDDENLVPAAELVRAGMLKARMNDGCPNVVATKRGVALLLHDGLVEPDTEMGGYMRVRVAA